MPRLVFPILLALGLFTFYPQVHAQSFAVDLSWSTYLSDPNRLGGGYFYDFVLDEDENIIAVGDNGGDAMIFKLDASGSWFHWAFYLAGSRRDVAEGVALGPDGSIYVTGTTNSEDFPVTPNAFQTVHGDGNFNNPDIFVARISADGDSLLYASFYGGLGGDYGNAIDVNAAGDCFVGGYTNAGNVPTTPGAYNENFNGAAGYSDMVLFRMPPTLDQLTYSTYIGGSQSETINALIVNDDDEVIMTGQANSFNFPVTPGAAYPFKVSGNAAAYMTRINGSGTQILASTYLDGNGGDYGEDLALNAQGDVYIVGRTYSNFFPLAANANDSTINGDADGFLARISKDATVLQQSTYLGGTERDIATGVAVNARGEIFVVGTTSSTDFPLTDCVRDTVWGGTLTYWGGDAFLTKYDSSMQHLLYNSYHGGTEDESLPKVLLTSDPCEQAAIVGLSTASDDFSTTPGALFEQKLPGSWFAVSRFEETLDATIAAPEAPCLDQGVPFDMSPNWSNCGHWSVLSTWQWDLGDGRVLLDSAISPVFQTAGQFNVRLGLPGCPPLDSQLLDLVTVDLGPDLSVCANDRRLLRPAIAGASALRWWDGATGPTHELDKSGWIRVEAISPQGCVEQDSIWVEVLGPEEVEVPNVFTPNGDGINDAFFVTGLREQPYDLTVYDRWGKLVHSAFPYNNDWEGDELPEGTYYFILTNPELCGNHFGEVQLLR